MFTFLIVIQALIAAALVGVILMQRSEGGGLTSGGSPAGLMSARGAADFLTRTTAILATMFVGMSILLAVIAATRHSTAIDASQARQAPVAPALPAQTQQPAPFTQPGAPEGSAAAAAALQEAQKAPASNQAVPLDK